MNPEVMCKALEFYADKGNWEPGGICNVRPAIAEAALRCDESEFAEFLVGEGFE